MSTWHTLFSDPATLRSTILSVDDDDTLQIYEEQDIEPVLKVNQLLRNHTDERHGWRGEMHRVASIPLVVFDQLLREGKTKDKAYMRKWLNDPANVMFRTRSGRV